MIFQLGEFECAIVSDGTHAFPARNLFANAPESELAAALAAHGIEGGEIVLPFHCLLVNTGDQMVLIDTGPGEAFGPESGRITSILRPDDIDVVLLSHGHADHAGGAPKFPHARCVLGRTDYEFWMDEKRSAGAGPRGVLARRNLAALASRLELIEAGDEPVPGIRAIAAPGHTPGNLAWEVTSGGETALYVADAAAHPIHFEHPDWCPEADLDPAQAVRTRCELLDGAAARNSLVCAYHLPWPAVGHVAPRPGGGYDWHPLLG